MGIGVDILKIDRIKSLLESDDTASQSFINKVYTASELAEAVRRENSVYYYATRFAAKEAVFKALGINGDDIRLCEIEILSDENGRPYVNLHDNALRLAGERGVRAVEISISYETDYAVAFAQTV